MALDEPAGTVSDVLDARRAVAAAVKEPWWVRPLFVVGGAAAMAVAIGGGVSSWGLIIAVVIMLATIYLPIVVVSRGRRALGVRLRRRRRTRRQLLLSWLVLVVFVAATSGLAWVLPAGTPLAYAGEFVAAAIILTAYLAVATRDPVGNNAARMVLAEDRPGQFDPLIASRSRLRLCTCLAVIEEIELGLLARCLQRHPHDLTPDLAELTAAHYVCFRDDAGGRRWLALTPDVVRTRFRRHLAALLADS
jgi:hypothetical protein